MRNPQRTPTERLLRTAAMLYAVALTYLLLAPEPLFFLGDAGDFVDKAVEDTVADRLLHAGAYVLFSLLLTSGFGDMHRLAALAGVALLHGVLCEVAHSWIPRREFDWLDLIANISGVLMGAMLCVIWRNWQRRLNELRF